MARAVGNFRLVLVEIANHLSSRRSRDIFPRFMRAIRGENRMTIVPASRQSLEAGSALYEAREDKDWSLTDCISFEIMRGRNLNDALTADRHFAQAGFNILMK